LETGGIVIKKPLIVHDQSDVHYPRVVRRRPIVGDALGISDRVKRHKVAEGIQSPESAPCPVVAPTNPHLPFRIPTVGERAARVDASVPVRGRSDVGEGGNLKAAKVLSGVARVRDGEGDDGLGDGETRCPLMMVLPA
jgi:hypothetical protein